MTHKVYEGKRGAIHYWTNEQKREGEPAFVFLHGLTADHSLYDPQVSFFSEVGRVLIPDLPLHGLSRNYEDFSFEASVADLEALLEKEQIFNMTLVGQSAGGYFAQALIERCPSKVTAFIGIGTNPLGSALYSRFDLFWVRHFADLAKWYPYRMYCRASAKAAAVTAEAEESFYHTLLLLGKKGMLRAGKLVYDKFAEWNNEVEIACPVLLIVGASDGVGYVRKYNDDWSRRKGYPLKILKNAGHNANYDNAEAFNQLMYQFLFKDFTSEQEDWNGN